VEYLWPRNVGLEERVVLSYWIDGFAGEEDRVEVRKGISRKGMLCSLVEFVLRWSNMFTAVEH